jgi:ubiquitin carboxyl-terminal hydrolase 25
MKETWITELPKALIFSLNRVSYDVKSSSLVKNCKLFEFDKTIYADKYLIENMNRDKEIDEQISKLKAKQAAIKVRL